MRRNQLTTGVVIVAAILVVAAATQVITLAADIRAQAYVDEAHTADIIIVLGAAEYSGRPSPVLEARLTHALRLYNDGNAPLILTTGGAGGDPMFTEGGVSQHYLSGNGVPAEAILVESEGESTVHSMAAAGEIMQRMQLKSAILVSDNYHIYRVKKLLEAKGLTAYGSPRPHELVQTGNSLAQQWIFIRQAIAYDLWRIGIPI